MWENKKKYFLTIKVDIFLRALHINKSQICNSETIVNRDSNSFKLQTRCSYIYFEIFSKYNKVVHSYNLLCASLQDITEHTMTKGSESKKNLSQASNKRGRKDPPKEESIIQKKQRVKSMVKVLINLYGLLFSNEYVEIFWSCTLRNNLGCCLPVIIFNNVNNTLMGIRKLTNNSNIIFVEHRST